MRPRHNNRFRRRPPNWNRNSGRNSPRMFEDGEIQSQSPVLPPLSPPWRRQHRFPRPFKRPRRNGFPPRSLSPSPPRSRTPFLGPVPMLEIPSRRRSRFDITPNDERMNAWHKPDLHNNPPARNQIRRDDPPIDLPNLNRSSSSGPFLHDFVSPKTDAMFASELGPRHYQADFRAEERMSMSSNSQDQVTVVSAVDLESTSVPGPNEPSAACWPRAPRFTAVPEYVSAPVPTLNVGHSGSGCAGSKLRKQSQSAAAQSNVCLSMTDSESISGASSTPCHPMLNVSMQMEAGPIDRIKSAVTSSKSVALGEGLASASAVSASEHRPLNYSAPADVGSVTHDDRLPVQMDADSGTTPPRPMELGSFTSSPTAVMQQLPFPIESMPNQSDLLKQIQKLDEEIAEIELSIAHQRNLIEEKTSVAATESDAVSGGDHQSMVVAESERSDEIFTENRRLAGLSAQALAKLHPSWLNERLHNGAFFEPLYREPGQCSMYKQVEQELFRILPRLMRAIRHRKLSGIIDDYNLSLQWWSYYREWRLSMSKIDVKSLRPAFTAEQRDYYASRLAQIPAMLSEKDRTINSWRSRNALVEDPRAQDQYRKLINPWSDQEKALFRKKFSKFPKNFIKISTFLTNKSVGDCVAYYYSSKTLVNYKALVKKYRQNLLSRKGIDITGQTHVDGIRSSRADASAQLLMKSR